MDNDYAGSLGFALICNYDGVITEVLWDDFEISDNLVGLSHFVCIFDPSSMQKGLAMFLYVKEHGVALGWEINVTFQNAPHPFIFTAASLGDRIVLLASAAWQGANQIYEGLSQLVNKQVNNLRVLNKKASACDLEPLQYPSLPEQFSSDIVSDMLQLNSRLVNAERELARKNAELKRMSTVLSKDLYLAHRVLQYSGEAVVIANKAMRVIDVNQAYTAITGFGKQEAIGLQMLLNEPGHGEEGLIEAIWESLRTRGLWQGECVGRRKNGELFPKWLSFSMVLDPDGETSHYLMIFSDITRLKHAEEKWQKLAFYDSLTNLPNRVLFKDRLQQAITNAHRNSESLVLLFIDLDDFKVVNDSLGHDAGDELLCEAARRIGRCVRETDSLCRLGGDEFTVIASGYRDEIEIMNLCDRIIWAFNQPFLIQAHSICIGASIGIARYPSDGENPEVLIKNADTAMYDAKAAGRNTSRFFSRTLGDKIANHLTIKAQIALGLQRKEFVVYLQPEVELASGKVTAMEALIRWRHPKRGLVPPNDFIPIAEDSGLIVELGQFVISEAIRLVRNFRENGWPDMRVAVNISRRQLAAPNLTTFIVAQLEKQGLPGRALIVEITESMVMGNMENAIHVLQALKKHGIEAAIDDFGTGYSSLSFLHRLPVEFLKIDKSFVNDIDVSTERETIVRAISAMAASLGLKTIAEGVERCGQKRILSGLGCHMIQGYWYSKPLPYDLMLDFMKRFSQENSPPVSPK